MTHLPGGKDAIDGGMFNKEVSDYELTAVYRHPEATADIVLVHGLKGHPKKTWRSKNDVFWPTDLLPASLENEKANVLVYGYNADVYTSNKAKSPSDNYIFQHARSLVTSLTQFRRGEKTVELPIIWVVHSFGGIVVKKALLFSQELQLVEQQHYRSLFVSTYAIIFLGTPHNGSDIAKWGHVVEAAINIAVPQKLFATESRLLKSLKKDNGELQDINRQFSNICGRFKMHMVHENHKTDIKTTKQMIVDSESACPQPPGVVYYGIEATHAGMCKFDNINAPGFRNISTAIRDWVHEASLVVSQRWIGEHESRRHTARYEMDERMISLMHPHSRSPRSSSSTTYKGAETPGAVSMLPMPTDQFVDPTKLNQTDKKNPILIQTGEEVSDYMHQLDGKGHALLDTSTASVKYDEYAHKWKAQEFPTMTNDINIDYYDLYQDCFGIRDSLIATINKFRNAHGQDLFIESKPETRAGVQEAVHRFHDLLRSRSNSLEETNSAERLRKAYDNPTDDSFDFISFVSKYTPTRFLLTSVVCAGLKTLLAAMKVNMYQGCPLRKILEELPGILNRPTSFIEVLGADEEFHRKISAVYSCMLKLLRVSLKLFVGSTEIHHGGSDSSRLEKLVDRVAMLKMRAKKLHSYASSVSYLKLKELQVLQERNLFVSSLSLRAQDELKQRLDETLQRVMALEGLKEILIDDRRRDLEQLRAKTPDRPEHEGGGVDETQKELPTQVAQERAIDTAVCKSSENAPDEGPTIQQILELLEYDPAIIPSDCSKLLRIQPMIAGLKSSRMLYVVNNIRLRAWLEVDESSLLLINGGGDSSPISEVSYITARLAESFITVARPARQIMAMAYFCGQHRHTGSDVYASPTEMGMNLLCQLIDNGKEVFASEIVLDALDGLEPSEMVTICNSVDRLLTLLRSSVVVFIVIEGLNFFSYPASRQAETRELLGRLISIQRRTETATIKLLFTCPSRVLFLEDMVKGSEIMTVPRSPPDLGVWKDSAFSKLFDEVLSDPDDSSDDSQEESRESATENSLK